MSFEKWFVAEFGPPPANKHSWDNYMYEVRREVAARTWSTLTGDATVLDAILSAQNDQ